jgi:hypothetical protein
VKSRQAGAIGASPLQASAIGDFAPETRAAAIRERQLDAAVAQFVILLGHTLC